MEILIDRKWKRDGYTIGTLSIDGIRINICGINKYGRLQLSMMERTYNITPGVFHNGK